TEVLGGQAVARCRVPGRDLGEIARSGIRRRRGNLSTEASESLFSLELIGECGEMFADRAPSCCGLRLEPVAQFRRDLDRRGHTHSIPRVSGRHSGRRPTAQRANVTCTVPDSAASLVTMWAPPRAYAPQPAWAPPTREAAISTP